METQNYIFISNAFSRYGAGCLEILVEKGEAPSFIVGLNRVAKKPKQGSILSKFTLDELLRYGSLVLLRKFSLLDSETTSRYFLEDGAKRYGIPYAEVRSLNSESTRELLEKQKLGFVVVCSLSQIVGKKTLQLLPIFNLHPGGLPENQGANPIERSVLLGHRYVAASLHRMTEEIDKGTVYSRVERSIEACFCWSCVMKSAIEAGAEAIAQFLVAQRENSLHSENSSGDGTYYPKVSLGEKYLARFKLGYRFVYRRFTA